jgi:hypothetical protein
MQAFLMNCPIDYSEVPSKAPTPVPTLVPTSLPTSKLARPFIPSLTPTNPPMKPRFLQPEPPSWGCVETKSHGTKVPSSSRKPILRNYESKGKNVSWRAGCPISTSSHPSWLPISTEFNSWQGRELWLIILLISRIPMSIRLFD